MPQITCTSFRCIIHFFWSCAVLRNHVGVAISELNIVLILFVIIAVAGATPVERLRALSKNVARFISESNSEPVTDTVKADLTTWALCFAKNEGRELDWFVKSLACARANGVSREDYQGLMWEAVEVLYSQRVQSRPESAAQTTSILGIVPSAARSPVSPGAETESQAPLPVQEEYSETSSSAAVAVVEPELKRKPSVFTFEIESKEEEPVEVESRSRKRSASISPENTLISPKKALRFNSEKLTQLRMFSKHDSLQPEVVRARVLQKLAVSCGTLRNIGATVPDNMKFIAYYITQLAIKGDFATLEVLVDFFRSASKDGIYELFRDAYSVLTGGGQSLLSSPNLQSRDKQLVYMNRPFQRGNERARFYEQLMSDVIRPAKGISPPVDPTGSKVLVEIAKAGDFKLLRDLMDLSLMSHLTLAQVASSFVDTFEYLIPQDEEDEQESTD